jgi:hypothetical protein
LEPVHDSKRTSSTPVSTCCHFGCCRCRPVRYYLRPLVFEERHQSSSANPPTLHHCVSLRRSIDKHARNNWSLLIGFSCAHGVSRERSDSDPMPPTNKPPIARNTGVVATSKDGITGVWYRGRHRPQHAYLRSIFTGGYGCSHIEGKVTWHQDTVRR